MMMLYNSDSYAVVQIDVPDSSGTGKTARGGFEIVDKFARKEIFLDGALADSFRDGVQAIIDGGPSEEQIDEFIGRFTSLMQQPVILH